MKRLVQQNGSGVDTQALTSFLEKKLEQKFRSSLFQRLGSRSSMEADIVRLKTQADIARSIVNSTQRVNWSGVLREISAMIPKTMWLTDLAWEEGDEATFDGVALSYDAVFRFRDALTESPYFDSVKLASLRISKTEGRSLVQFQILCGIMYF